MGKELKDPIHAGEILAEELEFMGINPAELAKKINVPKNRIYQIVKGERTISADTALRLGKFFGSGARIWLNLQKSYELDIAEQKIADALESIQPYEKNIEQSPTQPKLVEK